MLNIFKWATGISGVVMVLWVLVTFAPFDPLTRIALMWILVVLVFIFAFCLTMVFKIRLEYAQRLMATGYAVRKIEKVWGLYSRDKGRMVEWSFTVESYDGALERAAEYIENGFKL